jgi:hypothetical protein
VLRLRPEPAGANLTAVSWWVLGLGWVLLLLLVVGLVVLVGLRTFRKFGALLRELGGAAELIDAAAQGRSPDPDATARMREGRPSPGGRTA